jgi:3-hydroxybutyryl-CoA dehydrogenase
VLALHFFSPVPVMKLVKVVMGLDTDQETVGTAEAFVIAIGKRPIRTKDRSDFMANKVLLSCPMAAVSMYGEGFSGRKDVHEGKRLDCVHPIGVLTVCDFVGLDVLNAVCDSLCEEFKRPEYPPPAPLMKLNLGAAGPESARGFTDDQVQPVTTAVPA